MCSVIQSDFEPLEEEIIKSNKKINFMCNKCSTENVVVILQKKHCYCRNCFLSMVNHKFRSTLGKTKLVKSKDKALVVFFGDQSSVALLQLIKTGVSDTTHKRLRFEHFVLFIDESILWPKKLDKKYAVTNVHEILGKFAFECYKTKLSAIYEDSTIHNFTHESCEICIEENQNDLKLITLFNEITNVTSKIDMLLHLRYQLLLKIALKYNCQVIFAPECGTEISIRLLSNIGLGRGSQIPNDVAVSDKRNPDVLYMRPLREITIKEIAYYNVFNKLEIPSIPSMASMFDSNHSIYEVTKRFIYKVQEEYPSTVYTVFHTGDKLKVVDSNSSKNNICILCYNDRQLSESEINVSLEKINECSKEVLSIVSDEINENKRTCDNCICKKDKEIVDNKTDVLKLLCHGCQRLVNDMGSLDNLPNSIIQRASIELNFEQMKNKIENFLL